ncbi:MAG: TrmB family transcriptional regulator [Candidatus Aenigmatarchaeota archaeon]
MVASEEVLDQLKTLGLNSYQRKLWAALLSNGASTAGELSDISDVPRSRTYDVLESLEDLGLVKIQTGKPMKYLPVDPEEALERLKKKHKEEYKETKKKIDRFKESETFEELDKLYNGGVESTDPGEFSGALKGRYQLLQQLETMFKNSKDRIHVVTSKEGIKEIYNNHVNHLQDASDRGVDVKIAAPISDEVEELVDKLSDFAEIRHIPETEDFLGRFSVVDGNEFAFALTHEDEVHPTQDVSFWSQSDHAAGDFLEPLFQNYWGNLKEWSR